MSTPKDSSLTLEQDNRDVANEYLSIITVNDPFHCAICGRYRNFLDKPGQKLFKSLSKREKKLLRLQNQAKLRSCSNVPKYNFGHQIPRANDCDHTFSIEKHNGKTSGTSLSNQRQNISMTTTPSKEQTKVRLRKDTSRFVSTSSLMISMMDDINLGQQLMDI